MIGTDVNFDYQYSLCDWTVGLADRSIFIQEVVLQEHVLENFTIHSKNQNTFWFWKMRNIFICHWVIKCYNEIHPKKIFHLQTSRLGIVMFEAISSIP